MMTFESARDVARLVRALGELEVWRKTLAKTSAEYRFVSFETVYAVTDWENWSGTDAGADGRTIPKEIVMRMLDFAIGHVIAELRRLSVDA